MESLQEMQREIEDKQEEMKNAVANQDFLGAAEIQKQIQDLKDELSESAKQAMQDAIASQDFLAAAEVQKILSEFTGGKPARNKTSRPVKDRRRKEPRGARPERDRRRPEPRGQRRIRDEEEEERWRQEEDEAEAEHRERAAH